MELSDGVPQTNRDDYGMPKQIRIEATGHPNVSDAGILADYHMESVYDSGPIIRTLWCMPALSRIHVLEPDTTGHSEGFEMSILGLAEIEVLSGARNVAYRRPVHIDTEPVPGRNNPDALTDGLNFYGELLPVDQWMRELRQAS